jgi:hypothetical protein
MTKIFCLNDASGKLASCQNINHAKAGHYLFLANILFMQVGKVVYTHEADISDKNYIYSQAAQEVEELSFRFLKKKPVG